MAALHPKVHELRGRRRARASETAVTWRELDLILDLLEIVMQTQQEFEDRVTKLETDTGKFITDIKAEISALEAKHPEVDFSTLGGRIDALDSTVTAADPGEQGTTASAPTKPVYTFSPSAEGAVEDPRFTPSGFQAQGTSEALFYFSEDPEDESTTNPNPAPGYTAFSGSVEAVPASA